MQRETVRPPRLFLFDMDGVLCRYDLSRRLEVLAGFSGLAPAEIRARLWDSGFENAADAGRYRTADAYLGAFGERLGYPLSRQEWIAARRAAMSPRPAMLAFARRFADHGGIALLTNNGPLMKEEFAAIFPEVAGLFGGRAFFSYEFGMKKPEPALFAEVLGRLGASAAETVFVDDKAHNAEGARRAGLAGLTFTSMEGFAADLAGLGIDIAA